MAKLLACSGKMTKIISMYEQENQVANVRVCLQHYIRPKGQTLFITSVKKTAAQVEEPRQKEITTTEKGHLQMESIYYEYIL